MRKLIITLSLLMLISVSCSSDDSSIDECTPIACLNGGTETVDCGCDCPEGFSGTDCSSQIEPSAVLISKITITSFPVLKPNGNYWDNSGDDNYPDVYVQLVNGNTLETLYISDIYYENVEDNFAELEFTPSEPISIQSYNDNIELLIFDLDDIDNNEIELMDSIELYLYDSTNSFPANNVFTSESSLSIVEVELSYEF